MVSTSTYHSLSYVDLLQTRDTQTEYTAYLQEYRDSKKGLALSVTSNASLETRRYFDLKARQELILTRDTSTPCKCYYYATFSMCYYYTKLEVEYCIVLTSLY